MNEEKSSKSRIRLKAAEGKTGGSAGQRKAVGSATSGRRKAVASATARTTKVMPATRGGSASKTGLRSITGGDQSTTQVIVRTATEMLEAVPKPKITKKQFRNVVLPILVFLLGWGVYALLTSDLLAREKVGVCSEVMEKNDRFHAVVVLQNLKTVEVDIGPAKLFGKKLARSGVEPGMYVHVWIPLLGPSKVMASSRNLIDVME